VLALHPAAVLDQLPRRRRPEMKLTAEEWSKWQRWMSKIREDLQSIVDDQEIARQFDAVVSENADWITANEGGLFCDFVRRSHAVAALLAIRRHLDADRGSMSMLRLLSQLSACADQFTYDFYLVQFPEKPGQNVPWQRFTYRIFSKNGTTFDKTIVDEDILQTRRVASNITEMVTRTLSHLDKRGHDQVVTYVELREVIDYFNRLVCKYHGLITSEGYGDLKTSILFPWKRIFKVPFVKPTDEARR
jgi:AbiU2